MSEAGEQVIQNSCPYKVDGEAGRFAFFTHSILKGADVRYNTGQDVFSCLHGKEYYRTTGFKEIALIYGDTEESYRKTTRLINRIRYQEKDGTPSRTLHEATEREGTALLEHITKNPNKYYPGMALKRPGYIKKRIQSILNQSLFSGSGED
ncbi:MAG: hypothetical protein QTN59_08285 [Candidatus Electrothrix communis]|nr:MAG: hypothetical protein QTN59_08285 [Candidatus Electrothrix communis]